MTRPPTSWQRKVAVDVGAGLVLGGLAAWLSLRHEMIGDVASKIRHPFP